jgi:hypothetical protein
MSSPPREQLADPFTFTWRLTMNNLTRAFTMMRQRGLIAEENFSCCLSCGIEEIMEEAEERILDGEEVAGFVFYHMQDNDDRMEGLDFHLAFGQVVIPEVGKVGLSAEAVGRIACECLAECQVAHEWDGDPDSRIVVLASSFCSS